MRIYISESRESFKIIPKLFLSFAVSNLLHWSYQNSNACTVVVDEENSEALAKTDESILKNASSTNRSRNSNSLTPSGKVLLCPKLYEAWCRTWCGRFYTLHGYKFNHNGFGIVDFGLGAVVNTLDSVLLAISSFDLLNSMYVDAAQLDNRADYTNYRHSIRSLLQFTGNDKDQDEEANGIDEDFDKWKNTIKSLNANEINSATEMDTSQKTKFQESNVGDTPVDEKLEYSIGLNEKNKVELMSSNMWNVETNVIDFRISEVNLTASKIHSNIPINGSKSMKVNNSNSESIFSPLLHTVGKDTGFQTTKPITSTVMGYRLWGGECQCSCPCLEDGEKEQETTSCSLVFTRSEDSSVATVNAYNSMEEQISSLTSKNISTTVDSTYATDSSYSIEPQDDFAHLYSTEEDVEETDDYEISSSERTENAIHESAGPPLQLYKGNIILICT